MPKIKEELDELSVELKNRQSDKDSISRIEDELGDVLFSCVNLARKLKVDPEKALRMSNHKFSRRFRKLEQHYHYDRSQMEQTPIEQLEQIWQSVK